MGLDPAYRAWTEFALDSVGGMDVEIFRLHVARAEIPVPEPPAVLVLITTGSPDSVSSSGPPPRQK